MTQNVRDEEKLTLVSLAQRSVMGVNYLVTNAERESQFLEEQFHVLTHELRLEVESIGSVYFTWAEEPSLNGHPIRLLVAHESSYEPGPDLSWLDASGSGCWPRAIGRPIARVRLFKEPSAYEGVAPPSFVTTGIELLMGRQRIQITVITPAADLSVPLSDWQWSPSTVVTVGCGAPDVSERPSVTTEIVCGAS